MRYRGGGIGHRYMRELEDRFEDMRREQVDPEWEPPAVQLPQDGDGGAGEPLAGVGETADSATNTSMADSRGDDRFEEEIPEDERPETHPTEDDYLGGEDSEEDSEEDDEVSQGTYGMAEY